MLRGTNPVAPSHGDSQLSPTLEDTRGSSQNCQSSGRNAVRQPNSIVGATPPPPDHLQPVQEYHSAFADVPHLPSPSSHQRQQSFSNLLPFPIRNKSISPERWTATRPTSEGMPLTGDDRRNGNPKGGGIAGWLSSTTTGRQSRPEDTSPRGRSPASSIHDSASDMTTPTRQRKNMAGDNEASTPKSPTPAPSRFAFLTSSMTATLSRLTQSPVSPAVDDELLNINVETALFPSGSPTEKDPFSPAAFKNLQTNATGLLLRMQNAYRQRVLTLRDLESEKSAQRDELEEAETRVQHLKMQLEGMARRAAEQEEETRALLEELTAEKKARAHERMMREKGMAGMNVSQDPPRSEASMASEDLGVEDEQRKRQWRKSLKSDGSFDTDDESVEDESVFSRSRSPTIAPSTFEGGIAEGPVASHPRVAALGQARPKPTQTMSTLQKIVKNVASALKEEEEEYSGPGCRNCQGQDASMAWNTVSLLRDENKHIKQRVGELETAIDGALDAVLDLR